MGSRVKNSEPRSGIKINRKSIAVFIRIAIIIFLWSSCYIHMKPNTGLNLHKKQFYTVLVMGTDKMDGINRSDTIILGFLDVKKKKASALFIPRDTRAHIPDIGIRKINAAYALGSLKKFGGNGVEKARQTIEDFLGVKIDFYAKVDLDGFVNIIDALGGITVRVMRNMNYVDKAGGLYIDIKKGLQVLNGKKAMQYVRFREKKKGDIGRITRQQKFIKAVLKKVKSPAILLKIPRIMSIVYDNLSTNMDLMTMFRLLNCYKRIRSLSDLTLVTLPGVPRYINKRSFYIADIQKFESLYESFFPSFFQKNVIPKFQKDETVSENEQTLNLGVSDFQTTPEFQAATPALTFEKCPTQPKAVIGNVDENQKIR